MGKNITLLQKLKRTQEMKNYYIIKYRSSNNKKDLVFAKKYADKEEDLIKRIAKGEI